MAIKIPRKSKKQRVNRKTGFADVDWAGWEKWDGQKIHRTKQRAVQDYYTLTNHKDNHQYTWTWMIANGYTKEDIRSLKAAPHISPYVAIHSRLLTLGMPDYSEAENVYWESLAGTMGSMQPTTIWLKKTIQEAIDRGSKLVEEKERHEAAEKERLGRFYKPSIQEVMREAAMNMTDDIESLVDEWLVNPDPAIVKKFEPLKIFHRQGTKANHARIIKSFYDGSYDEMVMLNNMPTATQLRLMDEHEADMWAQLAEGYEHYDNKQKQAALLIYKKIMDACDIVIAESKATRKPRKIKEKSAAEKVKKLKFKMSDTEYGIASEPPEKLIGAVACIIFNTKNRKLGIYVAKDSDGFAVRGTTLLDYNEETSLQKTLRKPQEQLSTFKKTTKVRATKEFGLLKTTETKLNGRFNAETVILACYK